MENELNIQGKKYMSSKRLAEITGYTNDHIARLCRHGKISGQKVGKTWFANLEELSTYQHIQEENAEGRYRDSMYAERNGKVEEVSEIKPQPAIEHRTPSVQILSPLPFKKVMSLAVILLLLGGSSIFFGSSTVRAGYGKVADSFLEIAKTISSTTYVAMSNLITGPTHLVWFTSTVPSKIKIGGRIYFDTITDLFDPYDNSARSDYAARFTQFLVEFPDVYISFVNEFPKSYATLFGDYVDKLNEIANHFAIAEVSRISFVVDALRSTATGIANIGGSQTTAQAIAPSNILTQVIPAINDAAVAVYDLVSSTQQNIKNRAISVRLKIKITTAGWFNSLTNNRLLAPLSKPTTVARNIAETRDEHLTERPSVPSTSKQEGIVVVPVDSDADKEKVKEKIRNNFSDKVDVVLDENNKSGIVTPKFRSNTEQQYLFMLVPIEEDQ